MKHPNFIKPRHMPTLTALLGVILGVVFAQALDPTLFLNAPPITVLQKGAILRTIFQSYAKESLPLACSLITALVTKHPLPILLEALWRGFLCGLSSSYIALQGSFLLFALHTALHLSALLTHIAAGITVLDLSKRQGFFPTLYFIGLLFLLTVIRLLAFTLIL